MKHGETQARAQQIINNGPALNTTDLALHLGISYAGARRVAEILVRDGKIVRDKGSHGMVMYRSKNTHLRRLAPRQQRPEMYEFDISDVLALISPKKKNVIQRVLDWVRGK